MLIDISSWKTFSVGDVFTIENGKGITKDEIECYPGNLPAIQSGEADNGCIGLIDRGYCKSMGYTFTDGPCLTVARTGSAGFVAYQPHGCAVGDSAKILRLRDGDASCPEVYLFMKTVLGAIRYKYDYGRKVKEQKYAGEAILLPAGKDGKPDYAYMKEFIRGLSRQQGTQKPGMRITYTWE